MRFAALLAARAFAMELMQRALWTGARGGAAAVKAAASGFAAICAWLGAAAFARRARCGPFVRINAAIADLRASGLAEAQLSARVAQVEDMAQMYQHIWLRVPVTLTEILPLGMLVALASAGVLRSTGPLCLQAVR